ncbi:acyl-CoA dehydrogenase family protein [Neobacillus drentensis]|uniref:acyl-CoA dehydrogenase family protein n=1 Tax=Neobacillus drentensis TaxID=220684 RepID=UPI002863963A|nr:acyl-CoA dehydrogenase family protein [Neobacillus drentensis]MDR7236387.1 3-hydroxy-9,10-secoandrosta-1,3,5(10)-triene-9,17-dione monooxygenase [Neobacillus drentensis]
MNQLTTKLTHEEAVERAKNIATKIKPRFKLTEELSRQPEETIQDFIDAGLISAMVPKRWGGHELGFDTLFRTAVEVAKADPSAGWCYTLLVVHSWMLAYFPEEAQAEVWEKNLDATIASSFASFPKNEIVTVEGGYKIDGTWGFSSGIEHSDYVMIQGNIDVNPANGIAREVLMLLVPKEDFEIQKTWKTVAQKGTGSNNILLENVYVPKHRTVDLAAWCQRGEGPGRSINKSLLYSHPLYAAMPVCLSSALLGASIGAYELWRDTLKNKVSTRNTKVADFTHQQIRVAEVSAMLAAAEALLEKTVERLGTGEPIDSHEKLRIRRNYGYVAKMSNQAVKTIIDHSGAGIVYEGNPLNRYWRDVQASSMHITFNFDWLGEMFGKMELDLPLSPKDSFIS